MTTDLSAGETAAGGEGGRANPERPRRLLLDITPIIRPDPTAPPFPPYTEEPVIVPDAVWRVGQVVALAVAAVVITLLFVEPDNGLVLWWLWLLPTLPLLWVLAPGIWRNVCPMATLNQIPRLLGISRNRRVPDWAMKHSYLVAVVFYFAGISARAPIFDHNGPALAVLMLIALGSALVGGLLFTGKSGWCGTFCPLIPIQKLYGQTPQVVLRNTHCKPCVGCMKNCYDFNPRVAAVADMNDEDKQWVGYRKLFAGTFPGFVVAFFTIPEALVAEPIPPTFDVLRYYALTGLSMLISLGLFLLAEALLPKVSTTVLTMCFAMLGLNLHNILRFTTTWRVHKPVWILVIENAVVLAITVFVVVRTWRQERRIYAEAATGTPGLPLPLAARGAAGAQHEVVIDSDRSVLVAEGKTLAEAARAAKAPVPSGCGSGVCGADPVLIRSGSNALSDPTPQELATLERLGLAGSGARLACSACVKGPVAIESQIDGDVLNGLPSADEDAEQVIIVGNGVAGTTVAAEVRKQDPDAAVLVVASEPHAHYNRMAIASVVHGHTGTAGIQVVPSEGDADVDVMLNTHVAKIDREDNRIVLGTGQAIDYDQLVLATGSDAAIPDIPGADLPGVFVLRTADDAIRIRAYSQQHACRRAVVLGGGLLGLEAAHGLHQLGLEAAIVTGGKRLLSRNLDERASELVADYMRGEGVELIDDSRAIEIVGQDRAEGLRLADGQQIPLDLLLICVGAAPRTSLAEEAGLDVDRGVIVDDEMRTSDERIYSVGDAAEHNGMAGGLWSVAAEQAEVAAANITGRTARWDSTKEFAAVLKDVGLNVVSIGEIDPPDDSSDDAVEVITTESAGEDHPVYRKLVLQDDTPVGAVIVGGDRSVGDAAVAMVQDQTKLSPAAVEQVHEDPDRIADPDLR